MGRAVLSVLLDYYLFSRECRTNPGTNDSWLLLWWWRWLILMVLRHSCNGNRGMHIVVAWVWNSIVGESRWIRWSHHRNRGTLGLVWVCKKGASHCERKRQESNYGRLLVGLRLFWIANGSSLFANICANLLLVDGRRSNFWLQSNLKWRQNRCKQFELEVRLNTFFHFTFVNQD